MKIGWISLAASVYVIGCWFNYTGTGLIAMAANWTNLTTIPVARYNIPVIGQATQFWDLAGSWVNAFFSIISLDYFWWQPGNWTYWIRLLIIGFLSIALIYGVIRNK